MLGAIIGGVASIGGALLGKKASDKATAAASEAEAAALAFEREKYDDWQTVFGPIQQNLSNYYSNLTPESYEAIGLEAIQREYSTLETRLNETLAQRGLTNSGAALALEKDLSIQEAEAKADVRRSAPTMAAAEKAGFLQIGLGSNPSISMSSALQSTAAGARDRANTAQANYAQALGSAVSTVGKGLSDYFDKEDENA